ncbi:unnamed protein product [Gadus morhua 'NCC']
MNHLRPHLTGYHQVRNVEETILLVSWSSGRVTGKLNCRVCDKVGLSRLDRHLADLHQLPPNDQLPLDSWLPPHPPLPPCLSIQWIALPLSSPVQCMSCTALEKRVEGLELAVCQLQATMSLQLDSSTATAQATSSAALASPSPGNTHSLDRETPSTPSQELELQAGRMRLLLQGSSLDMLQASLPQVQSSLQQVQASLQQELALELRAELPH